CRPEEEAAGSELEMNGIPADVRDEAQAEGRKRKPRPVDDLVCDQADEHARAQRGEPGRPLQQQVAETGPPPREGTAGYISGRTESGHDRSGRYLLVDLGDLLLVERDHRCRQGLEDEPRPVRLTL